MFAHHAVLLIESQAAVVRSWRARLIVVLTLFSVGAFVASVLAVWLPHALLLAVLLWAGTGCAYMAYRSVPEPIFSIDRPVTATSVGWAVAALALYVLAPVALSQWGLLAF